MPEGPEVRIIADQLQKLVGQTLRNVIVSDPKFNSPIHRGKIMDIIAIGKKLIIQVNNGYYMFRLGMTGKFYFDQSDYVRVQMQFDHNTLYYDDVRKLGSLTWFSNKSDLLEFLSKFGMVVLNITAEIKKYNLNKLNWTDFYTVVHRYPGRQLSAFLMDDSIIDGIGNYLKSEIAYHAGLRLTTKIGQFHEAEIHKLYHSIEYIMTKAYQQGGLTLHDFRDTEGRDGRYVPLIYGRDVVNGQKVIKAKTADGRISHYI